MFSTFNFQLCRITISCVIFWDLGIHKPTNRKYMEVSLVPISLLSRVPVAKVSCHLPILYSMLIMFDISHKYITLVGNIATITKRIFVFWILITNYLKFGQLMIKSFCMVLFPSLIVMKRISFIIELILEVFVSKEKRLMIDFLKHTHDFKPT